MNIKGSLSLLHENPAYLKDPLPAVLVYYQDAETKEENLFKHVKKKNSHFHINHHFCLFAFIVLLVIKDSI